jgi:hypothetical protein
MFEPPPQPERCLEIRGVNGSYLSQQFGIDMTAPWPAVEQEIADYSCLDGVDLWWRGQL